MTISQAAGILPAIIFPAATLAQLWRMIRDRSTAGVSATPWLLFGVANLAIYVYAERYAEWQSIVGMLLTALLDFIIVGVALVGFRVEANHAGNEKPRLATASVARGAAWSARH